MNILKLTFVALFISVGQSSFAQWVCGGEIEYTLLEEFQNFNKYELKTTVYYDCAKMSGWGNYRYTISLCVFDRKTGLLQQTIPGTYDRAYPLEKPRYSCSDSVPESCIWAYEYIMHALINKGEEGVILSLQGGTRPMDMVNVRKPFFNNNRYNFWTTIPNIPNSSPRFNSIPKSFVCADAPLSLDYSLRDPDGDSIVYFLDYNYGSLDSGIISNSPPPFIKSYYVEEYSKDVQMDANPRFNVDRSSGIVNGVPKRIGKFATSVGYREYRKGLLISEGRRDMLIKVLKCDLEVVANFTTARQDSDPVNYYYECSDTVFFKNTSHNSFTYSWDFGDPTSNADTSNLKNPSYVYPRNGDYKVRLIAFNSTCSDTFEMTVHVRFQKSIYLGPDTFYCGKINTLLKVNSSGAEEVVWNTGANGPVLIVKDTGTFIVRARFGQCIEQDTIRITDQSIELNMLDDTLFCDSVSIVLDAGLAQLNYRWNTFLSDTLQTLEVHQPGLYEVLVSNGKCWARDSTNVRTAKKPDINDTLFCNEFQYHVEIGPIAEATVSWSNGDQNWRTNFDEGGIHWMEIIQEGCLHRDSFTISNPRAEVDLGPDIHQCDKVFVKLRGPANYHKYSWNTSEQAEEIIVTQPGVYWLEVEDQSGCTNIDSVVISMSSSPTLYLGKDTTICLVDEIEIGPKEVDHYAAYRWNTGSSSIHILVKTEGEYILTLTDENNCSSADTIVVTTDENLRPNRIFIPNTFTPNNDGKNDLFPLEQISDLKMYFLQIYNRWGQKIFDSGQGNKIWNGKIEGETVPSETYFYSLYYQGCDAKLKSLSGTVLVLY